MVNVRLPDDLKDRVDTERGDVPRERWIRRQLERILEPDWDAEDWRIVADLLSMELGRVREKGRLRGRRSRTYEADLKRLRENAMSQHRGAANEKRN